MENTNITKKDKLVNELKDKISLVQDLQRELDLPNVNDICIAFSVEDEEDKDMLCLEWLDDGGGEITYRATSEDMYGEKHREVYLSIYELVDELSSDNINNILKDLEGYKNEMKSLLQ